MTGPARRALDGVRVVDLSVGVAGPLAGMMLADHGADVVKVEPDGGDPARTRAGFHVWNRGKRAAKFDAGSDGAWRWLGELVEHADVVLAGTSRPGVTYEMLSARGISPARDAVWVVLAPYLLGDTPWATEKESASLLYANLGHAWNQGSYDGNPVDCVYPIPLYVQGLWAATVAAAGLVGRARGWRSEGPFCIGGAHAAVLSSPGAFLVRRGAAPVERLGGPRGALPNYRCYQCKDGRWLFLGAYNDRFVFRALHALGLERLIADGRLAGEPGRVRLAENFAWLDAEIAAVLQGRTREAWLEALRVADVPVGPVRSREEWPEHPQVRALGLVTAREPYGAPGAEMPGIPVELSETPGFVSRSAPGTPAAWGVAGWEQRPPRAAERGEGREELPRTARGGLLPLEGLRAVDLGTVIAGPYAGTLLGELGCEVLKIERPPGGDDARAISGGPGRSGFSAYNRRQRSVVLDLRHERGRDVLSAILALSDVVIENFRPQVSARLGLGWEELGERHPSLTLVSISAFGTVGPFGALPGFDPIVQAISGIMRAQGGGDETASPTLLTVPVNDVVASLLGAFGACASLLARARGGRGQRVEVTLAGAATLLQSEELVRGPAAHLRPRHEGARDYKGRSPLNRYYRAADGWVFVDGRYPEDLGALVGAGLLDAGALEGTGLRRAAGARDAAGPDEAGVVDLVGSALGAVPCREVVARLNGAGVPAVAARRMDDLAGDALLAARRVLQPVALDHEGVREHGPGRFWEVVGGSDVRDAGSSSDLRLGGATYDVLAQAGVAEEEIRELVAAGTALLADEGPRT
ncbi:MAG: CoA transferase [Acidimicrobiales bacterium]